MTADFRLASAPPAKRWQNRRENNERDAADNCVADDRAKEAQRHIGAVVRSLLETASEVDEEKDSANDVMDRANGRVDHADHDPARHRKEQQGEWIAFV